MIHLRIRSEFTFRQTYAPIPRLVKRLKEIGATSAGIVDRDGTWGHVWWHQECKKNGITPILGVELTVSEKDDFVPGMWFLARNLEGLRELYHFTSKAFTQKIETKFGKRPRLHYADVIGMSQNVVKFAGEVMDEDLLVASGAYLDFSPASTVLNMSKRKLAARTGLKTVSVCDNAYAYPEDKEIYELFEGSRLKPTPQYITTENIDHGDVDIQAYDLPRAPMVEKSGSLEDLCREGIKYRAEHNGLVWNDVYEARLKRELDLITKKNFTSYFLIVSDIVTYAKSKMLVGPSRGSCGGSLVCYLSRITEIDPVDAGLYFERFIDESRKDLPDIDIDFPGLKRHIVFEYMREQYHNVANIGTVQRFRAKGCLDQVAKKLGIPGVALAATKGAIIERTSGDARGSDSIEDTLTSTKAGQKLVEMYPDIMRAVHLDQHADHTGRHAAGMLVCGDDIRNYATVTDDGTAQVEKKTVEALNLLKVDILGLRTLDILEDIGVQIPWYQLKMDDQKTFDLFNRQALSAIFQFDGQSMRNLSSQITFKSVHDIDAVTALARPGPFGGGVTAEWLERRNGKPYKSFHPLVDVHMKDTYGLPVYQEQTMAIVREIGQFDWNQVGSIRKAVSLKKGKDFFNTYLPNFIEGAAKQGMSAEQATAVWEYINSMGAYQMNKAHTYAYAVIGYWTAYLKAHFPLEFAAANLRHAKDEESALTMLQEMARDGMPYNPFDIQKSEATWAIKDGALQAGFDSLRGFGEAKAKKFAEARDAGNLSDKQLEQIAKATSIFNDLFPMHNKFRSYYEDWKNQDPPLGDRPIDIIELDGTQNGSQIFLGRLIQKNLRDANEEVNVKKRGGKLLSGKVMFLDFRIADDTGRVQCRIDRKFYEEIGKPIFESPIGTFLLVRARFMSGIRFGFVQKIKILEKPLSEKPLTEEDIAPRRQRTLQFRLEE